jgi:hypothetical protein
MIALLALLPALLLADAATYELLARTEARETSSVPGEQGSVHAQVLQLDLTGNANFQLGGWALSAGYSPRILLFLPDQANPSGVTGFNTAVLIAALQITPRQLLTLTQTAAYGTQDNSPLSAAAPGTTPAQQLLSLNPRLPLVEILATITATSQATHQQKLSPFITTTEVASFTLSGGADALAREFLPFQHSLVGAATLAWRIDKTDSLTLASTVSGTNFTDHSRSRVAAATLGWSTVFARATTFAITAGSSFSHSSGNAQARSGWQPAATGAVTLASVLSDGPEKLSYSLRAGVSTVIDPLGDGVFELGDARASLIFEPSRQLSLSATGAGGRALTGGAQAGQSVATLDVSGTLKLSTDLLISVGARGSWQALPPGEIGAAGTHWAGYAALTVTDRGHF